jgi:hypothetical protein
MAPKQRKKKEKILKGHPWVLCCGGSLKEKFPRKSLSKKD